MTSIEERQRRRALVRAVRDTERADAIARMPLAREHLAGLLRHLDQNLFETRPDGGVWAYCDHSYRLTEAFLTGLSSWSPAVQEWLASYGGYCDCEVAANVGSEWHQHL